MKKLIYLANSYSSHLEDSDAAKFQMAKRRLLESYVGGKLKKLYNVTLILPIAISGSMSDLCDFGTGFNTWAEDDYNFISVCNEVWVLLSNGWKESLGVQSEITFAKNKAIPVRYIDPINFNIYDEVPNDKSSNKSTNRA